MFYDVTAGSYYTAGPFFKASFKGLLASGLLHVYATTPKEIYLVFYRLTNAKASSGANSALNVLYGLVAMIFASESQAI